MPSSLTHLDDDGRARMIDVGAKPATRREALARGRMVTTAEVVRLLVADGLPKADALATARIAGIAGAKRTSDLIPLCHPLPIDAVTVDLRPSDGTVVIEARVSTTGRTGVEMEALTAVTVAGLTLHDMVKAVDPGATLTDVQLVEKTGGKHGRWTRDQVHAAPEAPRHGGGRVLVVSTGAAAGTREDTTGARIVGWLREQGLETPDATVVADADVAAGLRAAIADGPEVLITTGGTGPSPTDRTPEATAALLDRPLPGVAEALRTRAGTPTAALGRGTAGLANGTIVVNLPGSTGGVDDGLTVLADLLPHLRHQIRGEADHDHGAHQSAPHPAS
ncbi:bifunctional molybdenum cofactor biosynthesis protein MoaC/MoaB [Amnibacterium kyonggiense]|uniref:Cyclic pyranopterin monophosphate synthase n=1 Tax=Amnibacterium kyonggiense TaxID=595671 RepID=A0A4R7FJ77_9MICO|nr:bifunctional molybdenum cofactor biosynthesis protein MoaC/MoaB [Amnibacterium kyonggiense]TDS76122.1 cyclic pyranopterin monophosphate synthase subunit MoaC [Amnibacterium kyonggiense]